jgi:hypothetical protein
MTMSLYNSHLLAGSSNRGTVALLSCAFSELFRKRERHLRGFSEALAEWETLCLGNKMMQIALRAKLFLEDRY